jgi:hypothetical protein
VHVHVLFLVVIVALLVLVTYLLLLFFLIAPHHPPMLYVFFVGWGLVIGYLFRENGEEHRLHSHIYDLSGREGAAFTLTKYTHTHTHI